MQPTVLLTSIFATLVACIPVNPEQEPDIPIVFLTNSSVDNTRDIEMIFFSEPNYQGWGFNLYTPSDQPSSPFNQGQHCYFVESGKVSSIKLVKQPNGRRFSCHIFRTVDACRYLIPAMTLNYPAEVPALEPALDNQVEAAMCWWTSPSGS